jgi:hypothetical protein
LPPFTGATTKEDHGDDEESDTVLVRTGETVEILLDVTNPDDGWPIATSPSTTRAG